MRHHTLRNFITKIPAMFFRSYSLLQHSHNSKRNQNESRNFHRQFRKSVSQTNYQPQFYVRNGGKNKSQMF